MTPDQIIEAAKLLRKRELLAKHMADIDGRLRKLGVEPLKVEPKKPA